MNSASSATETSSNEPLASETAATSSVSVIEQRPEQESSSGQGGTAASSSASVTEHPEQETSSAGTTGPDGQCSGMSCVDAL